MNDERMLLFFYTGPRGDVITRLPGGKIGLPDRGGPQPQDDDLWECSIKGPTKSGKAVILTLHRRISTAAERRAEKARQVAERAAARQRAEEERRRAEEERRRAEEAARAVAAAAFMDEAAAETPGRDEWADMVHAWWKARTMFAAAKAAYDAAEAELQAALGAVPPGVNPYRPLEVSRACGDDVANRISQAISRQFAAVRALGDAEKAMERDGQWTPFAAPMAMRRSPEGRRFLVEGYRYYRHPLRPEDPRWVKEAVECWAADIATQVFREEVANQRLAATPAADDHQYAEQARALAARIAARCQAILDQFTPDERAELEAYRFTEYAKRCAWSRVLRPQRAQDAGGGDPDDIPGFMSPWHD